MVKARFLALLAAVFSCAPLTPAGAAPADDLQARNNDGHHSPGTLPSVAAILNGVTYRNKGIVGFGRIPSNFRESTGDTLGGIGSAMAFKHGTWKAHGNTFSGTMLVNPDRGFNVDTTIDYQARQHEIDFVLRPYYDAKTLNFDDAQKTLKLTYKKTTLWFERDHAKTTGLDSLGVRAATGIDPELPVGSNGHLSLDVEGLVVLPDGTRFISDEYGAYIYQFSPDGQLMRAIQPPKAFLPFDKNGNLNFTSEANPNTGRTPNQGFEGLTIDPANNILYTMLQTAAIQDGGDDKSTNRFTRMLAYNISDRVSDLSVTPPLVGEWVVPLPLSDKGKAQGCSELHFVSPGVFFALSRDGDGAGGGDNHSKYKNADLFSIVAATDIHGSIYDEPENPIAKNGTLNHDIIPATYVPFVSYIDEQQNARFGLRNDDPVDQTLLNSKWESLALAPINDPHNPDDYFLFTGSDNDFISTDGVSIGKPFNAGQDVDNQFLVFRVTLPGVDKSVLCDHIGAHC